MNRRNSKDRAYCTPLTELMREPKHPDALCRSNLQTLALTGDAEGAFAYAAAQLLHRLGDKS